eukprot:gene7293-409_t
MPEEALPFPMRLCTPGEEYFCGASQGLGCGTTGRFHLAWKMRLIESGYVIPGFHIHFFWFFMPALVLCSLPLKALYGLMLLLGAILVESFYSPHLPSYLVEGPAIWCFVKFLHKSIIDKWVNLCSSLADVALARPIQDIVVVSDDSVNADIPEEVAAVDSDLQHEPGLKVEASEGSMPGGDEVEAAWAGGEEQEKAANDLEMDEVVVMSSDGGGELQHEIADEQEADEIVMLSSGTGGEQESLHGEEQEQEGEEEQHENMQEEEQERESMHEQEQEEEVQQELQQQQEEEQDQEQVEEQEQEQGYEQEQELDYDQEQEQAEEQNGMQGEEEQQELDYDQEQEQAEEQNGMQGEEEQQELDYEQEQEQAEEQEEMQGEEEHQELDYEQEDEPEQEQEEEHPLLVFGDEEYEAAAQEEGVGLRSGEVANAQGVADVNADPLAGNAKPQAVEASALKGVGHAGRGQGVTPTPTDSAKGVKKGVPRRGETGAQDAKQRTESGKGDSTPLKRKRLEWDLKENESDKAASSIKSKNAELSKKVKKEETAKKDRGQSSDGRSADVGIIKVSFSPTTSKKNNASTLSSSNSSARTVFVEGKIAKEKLPVCYKSSELKPSGPSRFLSHRQGQRLLDKRVVNEERDGKKLQVEYKVLDKEFYLLRHLYKVEYKVLDKEFYLLRHLNKVAPDPCIGDDSYWEGVRRVDQHLEAQAVREIMSYHTDVRASQLMLFGKADLRLNALKKKQVRMLDVRASQLMLFGKADLRLNALKNKQVWMLSGCRAADKEATAAGRNKDLNFSRIYTVGCYRLQHLCGSTIKIMIKKLPQSRRRFAVFTLGQAHLEHIIDDTDEWARSALVDFTPLELQSEFLKLEPMPGPKPCGRIQVTMPSASSRREEIRSNETRGGRGGVSNQGDRGLAPYCAPRQLASPRDSRSERGAAPGRGNARSDDRPHPHLAGKRSEPDLTRSRSPGGAAGRGLSRSDERLRPHPHLAGRGSEPDPRRARSPVPRSRSTRGADMGPRGPEPRAVPESRGGAELGSRRYSEEERQYYQQSGLSPRQGGPVPMNAHIRGGGNRVAAGQEGRAYPEGPNQMYRERDEGLVKYRERDGPSPLYREPEGAVLIYHERDRPPAGRDGPPGRDRPPAGRAPLPGPPSMKREREGPPPMVRASARKGGPEQGPYYERGQADPARPHGEPAYPGHPKERDYPPHHADGSGAKGGPHGYETTNQGPPSRDRGYITQQGPPTYPSEEDLRYGSTRGPRPMSRDVQYERDNLPAPPHGRDPPPHAGGLQQPPAGVGSGYFHPAAPQPRAEAGRVDTSSLDAISALLSASGNNPNALAEALLKVLQPHQAPPPVGAAAGGGNPHFDSPNAPNRPMNGGNHRLGVSQAMHPVQHGQQYAQQQQLPPSAPPPDSRYLHQGAPYQPDQPPSLSWEPQYEQGPVQHGMQAPGAGGPRPGGGIAYTAPTHIPPPAHIPSTAHIPPPAHIPHQQAGSRPMQPARALMQPMQPPTQPMQLPPQRTAQHGQPLQAGTRPMVKAATPQPGRQPGPRPMTSTAPSPLVRSNGHGHGHPVQQAPRPVTSEPPSQQPRSVQHGQQPRSTQHGQQPQNTQHGQQPHNTQHGQQPQNTQHGQQPQNTQHGLQPQNTQHGLQPQNTQHGLQPQNTQHGLQPQNTQPGQQPRSTQHGQQPQTTQHGLQPQNTQHGLQPQNTQHGLQPQTTQHGLQPRTTQHGQQPQPGPRPMASGPAPPPRSTQHGQHPQPGPRPMASGPAPPLRSMQHVQQPQAGPRPMASQPPPQSRNVQGALPSHAPRNDGGGGYPPSNAPVPSMYHPDPQAAVQYQPVSHAGMPAGPPMRLCAASSTSAAPWRAQSSGTYAEPKDAHRVGTNCLAVVDGAPITASFDVNSAPFAQALSHRVTKHLSDPQCPANVAALRDVANETLDVLKVARISGAASVCLSKLDAQSGASGYVLLRPNRLTLEMEAINAWRPFNVYSSRFKVLCTGEIQGMVLCTRELQSMLPDSVDISAAFCETLAVQAGDVLIVGSHGLFDMVWLHGVPSTNLRQELYQLLSVESDQSMEERLQLVATQLATLAASMYTTDIQGTPLAQQQAEEGRPLSITQDIGDNAVITQHLLPWPYSDTAGKRGPKASWLSKLSTGQLAVHAVHGPSWLSKLSTGQLAVHAVHGPSWLSKLSTGPALGLITTREFVTEEVSRPKSQAAKTKSKYKSRSKSKTKPQSPSISLRPSREVQDQAANFKSKTKPKIQSLRTRRQRLTQGPRQVPDLNRAASSLDTKSKTKQGLMVPV